MTKRPNIVLIITDQQRLDTIAALGYDYMETPNLDRLVKGGTAFDNMYVTSPSCAPSRASLFSGVYPHSNGVFRNDEPWSYTWVGLLAEAGYRCVNVGKMHTSPFEKAFGFHERHVTENKDRDTPRLPFFLDNWDKALLARGLRKPSRVTYRERPDYAERLGAFVWELPEDMHSDVFVPQMAITWLDRYKGDEPFFSRSAFRALTRPTIRPSPISRATVTRSSPRRSATMTSTRSPWRCASSGSITSSTITTPSCIWRTRRPSSCIGSARTITPMSR